MTNIHFQSKLKHCMYIFFISSAMFSVILFYYTIGNMEASL